MCQLGSIHVTSRVCPGLEFLFMCVDGDGAELAECVETLDF